MIAIPLTLPHLAFTADISEDAARAAFERRYGRAPAQVALLLLPSLACRGLP